MCVKGYVCVYAVRMCVNEKAIQARESGIYMIVSVSFASRMRVTEE